MNSSHNLSGEQIERDDSISSFLFDFIYACRFFASRVCFVILSARFVWDEGKSSNYSNLVFNLLLL
jgi:hypothetical protein